MTSACSGGGKSAGGDPDDAQDGGLLGDGDTGFGDEDASLGSCAEQACAPGQTCQVQDNGHAGCTGSCEGITCPSGMECAVESNIGRCVPSCAPACGPGQRCARDPQGVSACVDNACADLTCSATEVCAPSADGVGNVCKDNRCDGDVQCPADQHCSEGKICVGDLCEPGAGRCQDGVVMECSPNGASEFERVTCETAAGLESSCPVDGSNCTCRDDWDCPKDTICELNECVGTGRPATCTLPPQAFADLIPVKKRGFPWGGDDADGYGTGLAVSASRHAKPSALGAERPFKRYAQVSAVPVVANLDDDNGDGLVNELDVPEIIFPAFCGENYFNQGMLRAVHGGGKKTIVVQENGEDVTREVDKPGEDYFAICGTKTWHEGEPVPAPDTAADCACADGNLEPNGGVAVGDLDYDGFPEIVYLGNAGSNDNNRLVIYNRRGDLIGEHTLASGTFVGPNPAVALANIDHTGFAEVVVGTNVMFLRTGDTDASELPLVVDRVLKAPAGGMTGVNGASDSQGSVSCVADLLEGGNMEIVAGATMYSVPALDACDTDPTGDECIDLTQNRLHIEWNRNAVGFCAIADVLDADDDPEDPTPDTDDRSVTLDGHPEVILVSDGWVRVYDPANQGKQRFAVRIPENGSTDQASTARSGGAPNIDDFDGDGLPEVGTAFALTYALVDFQPPTPSCQEWPNRLDGLANSDDLAGNPARTAPSAECFADADCGSPEFACNERTRQCVCFHNGWKSKTEDGSSRVTGSSVFDFNGDGAAEVVYNDECYFRIYEGRTGKVYSRFDSQSPTRIEYPVVADVDGDGKAEIIYSGSNARLDCSERVDQTYINGINVVGDPADGWISARKIWNQHAYHITNVHEDGSIPLNEVPSWKSYGGRNYNTYRSNLPPIDNIAPDLVVAGLQVTAPGAACGGVAGTEIKIVALIRNQGDLGTGSNVKVLFTNESDQPLGVVEVGVALAPGAETFVTLTHDGGVVPGKVKALVDYTDMPIEGLKGAVRECLDDNNQMETTVTATSAMPELRVSILGVGDACPTRTMNVTVYNDSDLPVSQAPVKLYAGNPVTGGTTLNDLMFSNLAPHSEQTQTVAVTVGDRKVNVHAVVDPDRMVAECDDSNNTSAFTVPCGYMLE